MATEGGGVGEHTPAGPGSDAMTHETIIPHEGERRLPIATFRRKSDNKPRQTEVTWETFRHHILTGRRERANKDGRLFSPVRYRNDATRGKDGVVEVAALVFDLDQGFDFTLRERLAGWEHVAYSTHSYTPEAPHGRVVLPLARSVPAEEWGAVYARAALLLPGLVDTSCQDVSRMFYLPSCPPGAAGDAVAWHNAGRWLDPDELPELPAPMNRPAPAPALPASTSEESDPDWVCRRAFANALSTATVGGSNGTGTDAQGAELARQLRDNRIPDAQALGVLRQYAETVPQDPSWPFTENDVQRWWKSAKTQPPREPWATPRRQPATKERAADAVEGAIAAGTVEAADPAPPADGAPVATARISQATVLVDLALQRGAMLFHSPEGDAYARVRRGDHLETCSLVSGVLRDWLTQEYRRTRGGIPGTRAVQDAIGALSAEARLEGPTLRVHNRIAELDGAIFCDLGDASWRSVRIDGAGWELVTDPPVMFRRPKGLLPLPVPERGGRLSDLRRFVNVSDSQWPLLAGFTIHAFCPHGPYPIAGLHGEQGTAKTTLARVLKSLSDPNAAAIRPAPKDLHELAIAADNSWLIAFDNLSGIPEWFSDALCRISTGGGFASRRLYTDSEEVLRSTCRPVLLTGIGELAQREDLVDRSLIITLDRIPDDRRKPETLFWDEFSKEHARLFGSILDAVSLALRRLPEVTLDRLPRMADFARFANAAEPAFGIQAGEFLARYTENRREANALAIESSLVASAVRALVDSQPANREGALVWDGTAEELLEEIRQAVGDAREQRRRLPANARALSIALRRCAPNLRAEGYDVEIKRSKRGCWCTIVRPPGGDAKPTAGGDAKSTSAFASPVASPTTASYDATFGQPVTQVTQNYPTFSVTNRGEERGRRSAEAPWSGDENSADFASPASLASPRALVAPVAPLPAPAGVEYEPGPGYEPGEDWSENE